MIPKFWTTWGTFAANSFVALICMALSLYVKIQVTDALKHYLPKDEFNTYKREHTEFTTKTLSDINTRFDKIEVNQEKNSERLLNVMVDVRQLLVEVRIIGARFDEIKKLGASTGNETNDVSAISN